MTITQTVAVAGSNRQGGLDTVAEIEQEGGRAIALPLELARTSGFAEFGVTVAATLHDKWQRDTFDYLVNNAASADQSAEAARSWSRRGLLDVGHGVRQIVTPGQ
jgi:NAD(P)-dependent dehydrogenase (short-subunit alcohol dehydrogenase family)